MATTDEGRWRLGNRNPRNLYLDETHVGMLIEPALAERIVAAMNGAGRAEDWGACCEHRAVQLDWLVEERAAGMVDAVDAIEALLSALWARTGSPGALEALDAVREWATRAAVRPAEATERRPGGAGEGPARTDVLEADNPPE